MNKDPTKEQVGGAHYKKYAIQPIEYAHANKLGPCEANIVKYATRWKDKGGIEDLEKIKHYADLLIHLAKNERENNGFFTTRSLYTNSPPDYVLTTSGNVGATICFPCLSSNER